MVAVIPVGVAEEEGGSAARSTSFDSRVRGPIDRLDVLSVDRLGIYPERRRPRDYLSGCRLGIMRVLVIQVVLADVDDRQQPELCEIHFLVEHTLAERAFAAKADP